MYTNKGKANMLSALGATHASLHTADPTEAGLNELASASYARQPISFGAVVAGSMNSSNSPQFNITAGDNLVYVGYYDALTSGNLVAYKALTISELYGNDGTFTLTETDLDLNLVP